MLEYYICNNVLFPRLDAGAETSDVDQQMRFADVLW